MLQDSGIDKLSNDLSDMDNVEQTFQKSMGKKGNKGAQALGIGFGSSKLDAEDIQMMGNDDDFMSSSAMGVEDMDKPKKAAKVESPVQQTSEKPKKTKKKHAKKKKSHAVAKKVEEISDEENVQSVTDVDMDKDDVKPEEKVEP